MNFTEKLTEKEAVDCMRKAWWELARTGSLYKGSLKTVWWELARTGSLYKGSLKTVYLSGFLNECPLCEWVFFEVLKTRPRLSPDIIGCEPSYCLKHCPVVWPKNKYSHERVCFSGGLYSKWRRCSPIKRRKVLAKQISELPLKKKGILIGCYESIKPINLKIITGV